ncbi:MAG: glycosyltransferase family 2 protein [Halobacteriota archaeon]
MELSYDETLERYAIAVVVPAYNEELLIQETLQGMPEYVTSIYVVDDGSSDGTAEQILALDDPRIVFIRHEMNKGVGASIITGYRLAHAGNADLIAVMGGDNQMDPEELPRLLVPVIEGDADYAKGNRLASRVYRKGMSRWRQFGNFVLTTLTKLASGYWDISDPQNGYTVISRKALGMLNLDMIYTYYGYCNDMLIKLSAAGLHTADVVMPARYGRERSSIRYGKYVRKVGPMLMRGFFWRLKTRYIVKQFRPIIVPYGAGIIALPLGVLISAGALVAQLAHLQNVAQLALDGVSLVVVGAILFGSGVIFEMRANPNLHDDGHSGLKAAPREKVTS